MSFLRVNSITGKDDNSTVNHPITLSSNTATLGSGVAMAANHAGVKTALNASGTAPIYAARAWVKFTGTGTVAINASGNVSSITDSGTGAYQVNFTTAMPDANYVVCGVTSDNGGLLSTYGGTTDTTTTRITGSRTATYALVDWTNLYVAIFR